MSDAIFFLELIVTGIVAFMFWKIRQLDTKSQDTLSRKEVHDMIEHETKDLHGNHEKLEGKIDHITEQMTNVSVTLARIDERMKR